MKLLKAAICLYLCLCQSSYADFNTGDTFGKGIVIQASGVTVTGGGRTLNFDQGVGVTVLNNKFNISASKGIPAGGTNTQVQYNNSGTFGGISNVTSDGTNLTKLGMAEASNLIFGTSTGTQIGTATTQKAAFWGSPPTVRPTGDICIAMGKIGLVDSCTETGGGGGGSGTVTSVTFTGDGTVDSSTPSAAVTTSGTVTATLKTQTANTVLAGPTSGGAVNPTFRALVGADLPNPSSSTLGGIESLASSTSKWINTISTSGVPSATQPAPSDLSGEVDGDIIYGSAGSWTVGTALPNGITATTQSASDNSTKVSTTAFVQTAILALNYKADVQEATAGALSPGNTYAAGVLTATSNLALVVDGITVATNDRVLVKNEATQANNGIYVVTQTGSGILPYILTRASDSNTSALIIGEIAAVESGTVNADYGFINSNTSTITIGTTAITYVQFNGPVPTLDAVLTAGSTSTNNDLTLTNGDLTAESVSDGTATMTGGAITGATYNGLTVTTTAGTLTIPNNASAALVTSGNYSLTLTATATTNATLPAGTVTLVGTAATQTLTNKRITLRQTTTTQSATPTINTDNTDIALITGLAQAITSFTTNLSGTPVDGDQLEIRVTDNGTARALTFGTSFAATTVALPTTTVISTELKMFFQYNSATSKWEIVGSA